VGGLHGNRVRRVPDRLPKRLVREVLIPAVLVGALAGCVNAHAARTATVDVSTTPESAPAGMVFDPVHVTRKYEVMDRGQRFLCVEARGHDADGSEVFHRGCPPDVPVERAWYGRQIVGAKEVP
jgi:hypothetical protein